jgi:tRNA pseudouridine13 synthase
MPLPYLTSSADFPGIGGQIKQRPEDFFVQEIPLYEPSGQGDHLYCEIQKVGLTTFDAISKLAQAVYIPARDIGYAGLKDARAITRQTLSLPGSVTEAALQKVSIPNLTILSSARHTNKLRLGHLKANRFAIRIREVDPAQVVLVKPALDLLAKTGLPNYFGQQRFGFRHNNHLLGAALVAGDDNRLLQLLLGSPDPAIDDSQSLGARKAFDQQDFERSMHLWPRRCGLERRTLYRLTKTGKPAAAVKSIDEKLRRLWVSALQSHAFNQVLAKRLPHINQLLDGDLAMKHENGACFLVENAAAEQPRADAFQISPTGPLIGYRMTFPAGKPLEMEQQVLAESGLTPESFRVEGRLKVKGARRALRVQPEQIELSSGVDEFGPHITLAFTLPAGSFATVLLREIMKDDEIDLTD